MSPPRSPSEEPVLELSAKPGPMLDWLRDIIGHRELLLALAAKDFKVRYKRASFGVLWAVALPLLQAIVMVVVFTKLGLSSPGIDYVGYVIAGVTAWSYIATTISLGATAIVDGAVLTDKLWFPRALLVLAGVVSSAIGLGIGTAILVVLQLLRGHLGANLILVVPAVVLLVALVTGLSLVTAALQVWFRDVKFIVQAALLVLFYVTPILYLPSRLGSLADYIALNPFAGVISLYQRAFVHQPLETAAVASSIAYAVLFLVVGAIVHRRNDRLFVDLL